MKISRKFLINSIAIGGLATAGALATATVSFAATNPTSGNPIITRVAQILGVDTTKVTDALKQAKTEQVDQMLKDGKITQSEADQMKQNIANGDMKGFGMGRPGMREGMKGLDILDNTASFLGMNLSDLRTALSGGQKLSDIVTSKGKTTADLKTYLTQKESDQLAQDVKDGKITQTQADNMKSRFTTMIDNFIAGNMPKFRGKNHMENSSSTVTQ